LSSPFSQFTFQLKDSHASSNTESITKPFDGPIEFMESAAQDELKVSFSPIEVISVDNKKSQMRSGRETSVESTEKPQEDLGGPGTTPRSELRTMTFHQQAETAANSDRIVKMQEEIDRLKEEKRVLEDLRNSASSSSENLAAQGKRLLDRIKQLQTDMNQQQDEAKQREMELQQKTDEQEITIQRLKEELKRNQHASVSSVVIAQVPPVPATHNSAVEEKPQDDQEKLALKSQVVELEQQKLKIEDKCSQIIREQKEEVERSKNRLNLMSQQLNEALDVVTQRDKEIMELNREVSALISRIS
jgi:DNA repair exonuclease SbcCD ATPase subunit